MAFLNVNYEPPSLLFYGAPLACVLVTSTNLSGSVRFATRKYRTVALEFVRDNPSWSIALVFSTIILPFARVWLLALVPLGWQYIRERHREAVEAIAAEADDSCARASEAAATAREDAEAAEEDARQAREIAATAARDGRMAMSLRATDFFDQSSQAWVPLQKVVEAARSATEEARNATFSAEELEDMAGGDDDEDSEGESEGAMYATSAVERKVAIIQRKLGELLNATEKAESVAENAQSRTMDCAEAQRRVDVMRSAEQENAKNAVSASEKASAAAIEATAAARLAQEQAHRARRCATVAKAEVRDGDVDKAKSSVVMSTEAVEAARNHTRSAQNARSNARTQLEIVVAGYDRVTDRVSAESS